jgi:ATP-dependent protease ClpP protease subunit
MSEMQKRIIRFICAHSKADAQTLNSLMMRPDQIATDCGSVLEADETVKYGIIDEVGGLDRALELLRSFSSSGRKSNNKNSSHSKNRGQKGETR